MTLEPVVDDFPWPKFLLQVQHESKIAGITEVGEFWAMLDERKLYSAGYSDAGDGQCNLIRNRLCDMQRKISTAGGSKHTVTDLASAIAKIFDMSIFTAVLKNSPLAKQCRSIIMMSSFVESTMDKQLEFVAEDLEQIQIFINDGTSIFSSFTSTPVGRQYIADFRACHGACRIFFASREKIETKVVAIEKVFDDSESESGKQLEKLHQLFEELCKVVRDAGLDECGYMVAFIDKLAPLFEKAMRKLATDKLLNPDSLERQLLSSICQFTAQFTFMKELPLVEEGF